MTNTSDPINILVSLDENLIQYLPVLVNSIAQNNDAKVALYIMHSAISLDSFAIFKKYSEEIGVSVNEIFIDNSDYEIFGAQGKWSVEAYAYLLASKYIPKSVSRILYLDIDTICDASLDKFYSMSFNGAPLIVFHHKRKFDPNKDIALERKEAMKGVFFNSGQMLINMDWFRDNSIDINFWSQKIEECRLLQSEAGGGKNYSWDSQYPWFADQGIMNFAFFDKVRYVDGTDQLIGGYVLVGKRPTTLSKKYLVVHFAGDLFKPWRFIFSEKDSSSGQIADPRMLNQGIIVTPVVKGLVDIWWKYVPGTPWEENITNEAKASSYVYRELLAPSYKKNAIYANAIGAMMARLEDNGDGTDCFSIGNKPSYNPSVYKPATDTHLIGRWISVKSTARDQWINWPLMANLQKGETYNFSIKLTLSRSVKKVYIFLSDAEGRTTHIDSGVIKANVVANISHDILINRDGYISLSISNTGLPIGTEFQISNVFISRI